MALVSPGTQVTIIDQSQYLPAASSSVPLLIVATATNKLNAAGTAIASGTTPANAGKLYQITSQRDLVSLFGNPFFYKTTNGTPIHGYELNEYGLLSAYSLLGITNRCYVLRADVDLGSLVGTLNRPKGDPADGTYWLDVTNSSWGIFEFNAITGKFGNKVPIVISNNTQVDEYQLPLASIGNIGDYCIDSRDHISNSPVTDGQYYYKTGYNNWVRLGSSEWCKAIPTVLSAIPKQSLASGKFYINYNNEFTVLVEINGNSISDAADAVNALGLGYLSANIVDGKMAIYSSSPNQFTRLTFTAHSSSPTILDSNHLGIGTSPTPYWQPAIAYGSSGEMPLWTAAQNTPRPTGSVWIKTSSAGGGISVALSQFSKSAGSFVSKKVSVYHTLAEAVYKLDAAGGKNIPAGTLIADTIYELDSPGSPMTIHKRTESGPTVVTGTVIDPNFTVDNTNNQFIVVVSVPNSLSGSAVYIVTLPVGNVGTFQFVQAWQAANIPYTTIKVTATKQIQITHTLGGGILIGPYITASHPYNTTYALDQIGLTPDVNPKSYKGYVNSAIQNSAEQGTCTNQSASGAIFNITATGNNYFINNIVGQGTGYQVGDQITIRGSRLFGVNGTHDLVVEVTSLVPSTTRIQTVAYISGQPNMGYLYSLSNWQRLSYIANEGAPFADPPNNTKWYYSSVSEVDIMVNQNGVWKGYRNVAYDTNGHPVSSAFGRQNYTDLNGPIIATDAPTTQSDGITSLSYGDLWLDSNDLENYPALYRWQKVDGVDKWVSIDNTDQTSTNGILFADARWATDQYTDPVNDPKPKITNLLLSNYLDLDVPLATLYPQGMLLFNTRRSGYNVKAFKSNYFNAQTFADVALPNITNTWLSVSGLKSDGSAYMGRKAQRNLIVQSMKAAIGTNMAVREEDTFLNLIAAPGYPELQPDMVELSNERNNTAFVVGDTPLRLSDDATEITAWATNAMNATATGEDGLVGRSEYMGIFYPSGITTDLTGAQAVVPASHMILRTILRNDTIAYPWLAPAGTRRGTIDNCTNIGYIDAMSGEFQVVKNRNSIRDVLYTNQINPLAFFTGVGLLNYGNKTSKDTMSALDRINVARLVCYIRERLQVVARPFIFEPNDARTRSQIQGVVQTLFVDLVAKRGLYDFLVVCDDSNNTADRIDRNELYIDIAIEPVKSVEFIYIPVRILNTGGIAKLK
jgi:hypothetical protein